MGLTDGTEAQLLWMELERLLTRHNTDYTIFWRQLAEVAELEVTPLDTDNSLLRPLELAFESTPAEAVTKDWTFWLSKWWSQLEAEGRNRSEVSAGMRKVSPKFIPREYILV